MLRRQAALFRLALVLCLAMVLAAGIFGRAIAEPASGVGSDTVQDKPAAKKAPAHQIPAELIEKLLEEDVLHSGKDDSDSDEPEAKAEAPDKSDDSAAKNTEPEEEKADSKKGEPESRSDAKVSEPDPDEAPEQIPPEEKEADQSADDDGEKPKGEASDSADVQSDSTRTVAEPGLPHRKPRKPVVRKKDSRKADGRKKLQRGSDKQKRLCRALQACRNEFIRCKSKIKYPDQSPEWSVAKEACGAVYKTCVEKDFQSGEWFFTRWFYFQELNCK